MRGAKPFIDEFAEPPPHRLTPFGTSPRWGEGKEVRTGQNDGQNCTSNRLTLELQGFLRTLQTR